MKHDRKVIRMYCIYDYPLYSGCPPLKLILYNQSQVQEAIYGLSHMEQCTEVLSFMAVDSSDSGDQSSSAAASSSKEGASSKRGPPILNPPRDLGLLHPLVRSLHSAILYLRKRLTTPVTIHARC